MEALQEVTFWLTQMGRECPASLQCETLTEGVSGSSTYRLRLSDATVVLKATRAESPAYVLTRACREVAFYRKHVLNVPLLVPQMLGSYDEPDAGCALLLQASAPAKAADAWEPEDYREMSQQLACFHAMFWNPTARLAKYDWLRPASEEDIGEGQRHALAAWQKLRKAHPHALATFTEKQVEQAVECGAALLQELRALPPTLCHNDCHIGNLLLGNGQFYWADWQEVGPGHGVNDLSFLYQRADRPPDRDIVRSYQERLEQETGQTIPFEAIWRGVVSSELWTRLIHWPHYLLEAPTERVRYHVQRVETLLHSL